MYGAGTMGLERLRLGVATVATMVEIGLVQVLVPSRSLGARASEARVEVAGGADVVAAMHC